jgi:hypothetical protein
MSFVFLDNATVRKKENRKLIRSHCMKGKNAGKTKPGPGRPGTTRKGNKDNIQSVGVDSSGYNDSTVVAIKSVFNDRFGTCSFPSPLSARMHDLLFRCQYLFLLSR